MYSNKPWRNTMLSEKNKTTVAPSANVPSPISKHTKTTTMTAVPLPEGKSGGTVVSATVDSCVFYATRKQSPS
jgi:hypothetical protein